MTIIADGTDLAGTAAVRFRATVTGPTTDTIKEISVADADSGATSTVTFSKGETVFVSFRNSSDVTASTSEHHITFVFKFNIPLGLI